METSFEVSILEIIYLTIFVWEKVKNMKKIILPLSISIAFLISGCQNSKEVNKSPEGHFTESEILEKAKQMHIKKRDIPFFCPPPEKTGINKCLTDVYKKNYPTNKYKGKMENTFQKLTTDLAEGKISKDHVVKKIKELGSWREETDQFSSGEIEYLVTNIVADTFETTSNLANEIWAERIDHNLSMDGAYYNVVIFYNATTKKNTVAVLGMSLAYIDPNGWQKN